MKFNELIAAKESIFEDIENDGGEISAEQESQIEALSVAMLEKIDNYGYYIVSIQKRIEGLKDFKAAVDARKKAAENYLARIKYHLGFILQQRGLPSVKGNVVTVKNLSKDEPAFDPESCGGDCIYQVTVVCNTKEELDEISSAFPVESVKKLPGPSSVYPSVMKYNVSFLNLKKLDVSDKE